MIFIVDSSFHPSQLYLILVLWILNHPNIEAYRDFILIVAEDYQHLDTAELYSILAILVVISIIYQYIPFPFSLCRL